MCGICGALDSHSGTDALRETVARMTATLNHRGPDGSAVRIFGPPDLPTPLALGHTRLAIIDLSDAGCQPMSNEDGSIWLVFNGEIYNFQELRAELEAQGHQFRSRTDSEVIVHLYEELGTACFERLNGIFALGIVDLRQRRLVLVRDHLGVKPLYYLAREDRFLFGSEIKAILASGLYPVEVDWQAISDYFTFLYVPSPATAFAGIRQVPPAHVLTLDLDPLSCRLEPYWTVRALPEVEETPPVELRRRMRDLLRDSVTRQLVSDVPLGVFLSGGVDSTIVAGLAAQADPSIQTFTVTFDGTETAAYDERETARAVSRHLGIDHHELPISAPDPAAMLELLGYFDQPFGNPTSYLMYLIARRAREHVTVALCGAGGDELFAGYPRYRAMQLARGLRWMPPAVWRLGSKPLGMVRDSYRSMGLRRAREFAAGLHPDPVTQFTRWTYFLDEEAKSNLIQQEGRSLPAERVVQQALQRSPFEDPDNRFLHADVQTFLLDNLLEYTDKMSMAVALEARVPLLDHRFVEFSLNVPFQHKLKGGRSKILLRETFAEFFPPAIRRAPKRGFNVPLAHWMIGAFDRYFDGDGPFAGAGTTWHDGVLSAEYIAQLRTLLHSGRADTSYELFAIMMFDVWWQRYVVDLDTSGWS